MNSRRDILKFLGLGSAFSAGGLITGLDQSVAQADAKANSGSKAIKITDVKAFACNPQGQRLCVVKVETSEPGLYGLGCATFNQRTLPVVVAVNEYLRPFAIGRPVDQIEDIWQNAYTSSYWRNGPVLNNALSGLDQALWDIKGKRAGMPVYELIGGKCRFAVDTYSHASGNSNQALEDSVRSLKEKGFRHIRIQLGGYGSSHLSTKAHFRDDPDFAKTSDGHMDPEPYLKAMPKAFEHIRNVFGDGIHLLHDVHERIRPIEAINLCKELEKYNPFFIEDPFSPEDIGYFKILRQHSTVPVAMGELFNNPHEWVGLVSDRLIDFIRVHISQVGGFSVARKLAILGEWFNVRTAWHGPGDVSPVGHAANVHLDLASHNFGIQEAVRFTEATQELFPGCPYVKDGFMYVNEAPGWGVDLNEKLIEKYPLPDDPGYWRPIRRRDGTAVRP